MAVAIDCERYGRGYFIYVMTLGVITDKRCVINKLKNATIISQNVDGSLKEYTKLIFYMHIII